MDIALQPYFPRTIFVLKRYLILFVIFFTFSNAGSAINLPIDVPDATHGLIFSSAVKQSVAGSGRTDLCRPGIVLSFLPSGQILIILGVILLMGFTAVAIADANRLRKKMRQKMSQLHKANELARENEDKFRVIAESTSDVIWISDFNFIVNYISPSVVKMLGGTTESYLDKKILDVLLPQHRNKLKQVLKEELEIEKSRSWNKSRSRILEVELYHAGGSTVWVELNLSFVRNKERQPVSLYCDMRNITEQVNARTYIQKRLSMEELLSDVTFEAIGERNLDNTLRKILEKAGTITNSSRAYIFNYNKRNNTVSKSLEWCAEGIKRRTDSHEQQLCEFSPIYRELLKGNIVQFEKIDDVNDEYSKQMFLRNDLASVLMVPLMLHDHYYGFMGFDDCKSEKKWLPADIKVMQSLSFIVSSLIERNIMERELAITEQAFELSIEAKIVADLNGMITHVNPAFLQNWRYKSPVEVLNKSLYGFLDPNKDEVNIISEVNKNGSWQGELQGIRSDHTLFTTTVHASLFTDKNGDPICLQVSFLDVTRQLAMT